MNQHEMPDIRKSKKPLYISIVVMASLILGYVLIPSMKAWLDEAWSLLTSGDQVRIHKWVDNFGWFGPLLIIIVMIVQMFLLVIPSWLLIIVAIVAYGPIWGSIIVFAAIFAASSVGYSIGRYFGTDFIARLIGPKSQLKVSDFLERYGVWAIIVTRLNPLLSNDAISLIAGVVQMGYRKFIISTLIGIAPLVAVIAVLGQVGDGFKTGLIWVSAVSLVLFISFVWWDRRRMRKQ
jgi:uncharacterized membrane protein YdjX (TVP38/TMEM64 family)